MIQKVKVEDLRPGMYIHDLLCSYLQHGFLRGHFLIEDGAPILKLQRQGIAEVLIDTGRGAAPRPAGAAEPPAEAVAVAELPAEAVAPLRIEAAAPASEPVPEPEVRPISPLPAKVPLAQEVRIARRVMDEAQGVVQNMLHDVRAGKQVDPARAEAVVDRINDSVLRNPGAMLSLCRIKEADTYTFQHSVSVCALLVAFTQAMGLDQATVQQAGLGGMLHDVGKMRVPPGILNKPGRLTEEEFGVMRTHATHSEELLQGLPGVSPEVIQVAIEHHEKVDGRGYPFGLKGRGISLLGRMAAVVDVYDAITSNRVYHRGLEPSKALTMLLESSGTHLDGDLVQQFIRALGIYPVGALVRLESGRLAVVTQQQESLLEPRVRVIHDAERNRPVPIEDLDLALGRDRIECYEEPEPWNLVPADYLHGQGMRP